MEALDLRGDGAGLGLIVLRFGSISDGIARAKDRLRGMLGGALASVQTAVVFATIKPVPDARDDGTTNTIVLGRLVQRHHPLIEGLSPAALRGARAGFDAVRSTFATIAHDAVHEAQMEIARRLRSGVYVTNTTATIARKLRAGRGATPGVDSEQLALSLEGAEIEVE